MANKRLVNKTLRAVKAELSALREFGLKSEKENLRREYRHERVASRFHQELIEKGFSQAGIDLENVRKRQDKQSAELREFRKQKLALIQRNSKALAKKQHSKIRQIVRLRRLYERQKINPTGLICLWLATSIEIKKWSVTLGSPIYVSQIPLVGTAGAGENWVKYSCDIDDTDSGDMYIEGHFFDFHFVWESPSYDGLVGPVSWVQPNGVYSLFLDIGCFSNPRAHVKIIAALQMGQHTPEGEFNFYADNIGVTVLNKSATKPHGGYVQTDALIPFGHEVSISRNQLPFVKDYPVIFTVTVGTLVSSSNGGEALLNISSGNYRVNVPSVWVVAEYF